MAAPLSKEMSMRDLYAPEIVRVVVGPNKRAFRMPRELICSKSAYFNKAFQRLFLEGQQGSIDLLEVEEWVFECFTAWLYTQRISWEPLDDTQSGDGPVPQSRDDDCDESAYDENDRQSPVTWQYKYLIDLYLFGDQYDTKEFRNAVMCHFQVKTRQTKPKDYLWPSVKVSHTIFDGLPETAGLYRFMVDAYVYDVMLDGRETEALFGKTSPSEMRHTAMKQIATKAIQLARCHACSECRAHRKCSCHTHPDVKHTRADFDYDMCSYHEHDTEDGRKACQKMWKDLCKTHGVNILPRTDVY